MKCIAAVIFFALAVCAQAGYLSYGSLPLAYSAYPVGTPGIGQYSSVNVAAYPYAAHSVLPYAAHVAAPAAIPYAYAAHSVYAAPHAVAVAPLEGTYTAATRGAVHTAPLPGHAVSQTSLNLAPAPGTL